MKTSPETTFLNVLQHFVSVLPLPKETECLLIALMVDAPIEKPPLLAEAMM